MWYCLCMKYFLLLFIWRPFLFYFIYLLFLEGWKRGRKRDRETSMWERNINQFPLVYSRPGPNPQSRHVPWLGIELANLHFAKRCPTNEATLVRAPFLVIFNLKASSLSNIPLYFSKSNDIPNCTIPRHPSGLAVYVYHWCADAALPTLWHLRGVMILVFIVTYVTSERRQ